MTVQEILKLTVALLNQLSSRQPRLFKKIVENRTLDIWNSPFQFLISKRQKLSLKQISDAQACVARGNCTYWKKSITGGR